MKTTLLGAVAALSLIATASPLFAKDGDTWVVRPEWVRAHEAFLASDALQGRGSATRDEAIAAAYVASQFEGYGIGRAPGMDSYLQTAAMIRRHLTAPPQLVVGGAPVEGLKLLSASGSPVSGKLVVISGSDPAAIPDGADVVLVTSAAAPLQAIGGAANAKHVKLLLLPGSAQMDARYQAMGGRPSLSPYLEGMPSPPRMSFGTLPAEAIAQIAGRAGADAALSLPGLSEERAVTTNAIGYIQGTDPKAGTLLFSAHLDHLGVRPDGTIMHGANDDASGTTAVLELAHALAAGKKPRRSILFVAYGSEEIGEFGSRYFGGHSPVPLTDIIANLEFEMIGAQDPKLPAGDLMMTGYDRSNFGAALKSHGALVTADIYPDEHFFERSDNYQLALQGIVAHTVSGYAVTPTYHQPTDTIANLDIAFMTRAIQSLIGPARWLADGDFQPAWNPGGRPSE